MVDKFIETEDKDLMRDMHSKALTPKNTLQYRQYQQRLHRQLVERKKLDSMQTQINTLKSDMSEIKDMLKELLKNAT